ncbi:cellulase family glycosylhydrolase [Micromonospora carbonacea]|uniref:Cellulase (Glycosyl hydrolase family 5) n=1 Tax=Micromonospora carbonacea TaxID=47853 RepID=A0A1C4YK25_9ACTN|nr:cellulase family glycosylhydrolase [Micromonospora carbonacea]SCF21010.1 Cellulase (glycosyl hydrolase family 5) [Micromonospora carbonacea]
MTFRLHEGRLLRDDEPFTALGVTYFPVRAGCRLWVDWDPDVVAADLRRIADAGLNTVRVFVFWRDFHPEPGRVDAQALARLRRLVELADAAGLSCVLSVLTLFMNGQLLDLPWRGGRSLWRDPEMLAAQETFVRAVAATVADRANVLALDLGDEISNVDPDEAATLTSAEVAHWYGRLVGAIRQVAPEVLVCQANNALTVLGGSAFGPATGRVLDLLAVHGFPLWSPGHIESTLSPKATQLPAFLARLAGAYGVALVDELGTYGAGDEVAAAYLRASAASVLANGAAGVIVWCWQDSTSTAEPYDRRPAERMVGLHRADGTPKPAMAAYRQVVDAAPALVRTAGPARVAVWPVTGRPAGGGSYLDPHRDAVSPFFAYLLLKRLHVDADVVAAPAAGHRLLVCPSVDQVTLADLEHLRAALHRGATVYYSLGDHLHGFPGAELVGAEIVDYDLTGRDRQEIRWDGEVLPVDWAVAGAVPTTLRATSGRALAAYPDGTPAVVVNAVGAGRLVFTNVPFERQLDAAGRFALAPWERFYRRLTELAGVGPVVRCSDPEVEVVPVDGGVALVNHRDRAVTVRVGRDGDDPDADLVVDLTEKGWTVARLPMTPRRAASTTVGMA